MYSSKIELDKFYTKESIAKECISLLDLTEYDHIIEPSAGSGAFSKNIPNCIAYDISPEESTIIEQDWFSYENKLDGKILVIGNPPFGKRNHLSKSFIKHALPFAQTIAFILPDVYQKHTLQSIFPKDWRLKKIHTIPNNAFEINDKSYHVPCSFFIFDKSKGNSLMFDINNYKTCDDFDIVLKNGDIFIMGAGLKVKMPTEVTPTNRGYWLKSKIKLEVLIENINNISFKGFSSANGGVSWLTKQEFIKAYNESKK
jgi:hypothetical protein